MTQQTKAPPVAAGRGKVDHQRQHAQFTTGEPPIDKLLPRLEGVKSTGPRKWVSLCPAHADKRPSLSIREVEDGRLLLHCWSGCGGADVVDAVGLRLHDLFPRSNENRRPLRSGERWIPRDALLALANELLVAVAIVADAQFGTPIPRRDLDRLAQITARLRSAAAEVGCRE